MIFNLTIELDFRPVRPDVATAGRYPTRPALVYAEASGPYGVVLQYVTTGNKLPR